MYNNCIQQRSLVSKRSHCVWCFFKSDVNWFFRLWYTLMCEVFFAIWTIQKGIVFSQVVVPHSVIYTLKLGLFSLLLFILKVGVLFYPKSLLKEELFKPVKP